MMKNLIVLGAGESGEGAALLAKNIYGKYLFQIQIKFVPKP